MGWPDACPRSCSSSRALSCWSRGSWRWTACLIPTRHCCQWAGSCSARASPWQRHPSDRRLRGHGRFRSRRLFVAAGLAGLVVTVALGLVFTQVLGGTSAAPMFAEIAARGVPVHAAAGLGGWLAMCAVGVSYRLFPMFLLSPDPQGLGTRLAFLLSGGAVVTAIVGGLAGLLAGWPVPEVMLVAAIPAAGAAVFYGRDVVSFLSDATAPGAGAEHEGRSPRVRLAGACGGAAGRSRHPGQIRNCSRGFYLHGRLRMAVRTRTGQAIQDRALHDLARMLWPGSRSGAHAAGSGSFCGRRGPGRGSCSILPRSGRVRPPWRSEAPPGSA